MDAFYGINRKGMKMDNLPIYTKHNHGSNIPCHLMTKTDLRKTEHKKLSESTKPVASARIQVGQKGYMIFDLYDINDKSLVDIKRIKKTKGNEK